MRIVSAVTGFLFLFVLYHAAEYMVLFRNSSWGFMGFQCLFFISAFLIGKWQGGNGFSAWGLDDGKGLVKNLLAGMLMGILLYGITYCVSLAIHAERVTTVPSLSDALVPVCIFTFGAFFSSFSEDILTRGYLFFHLRERLPASLFIGLSAAVYLLNHIYRLKDGPEALIYLFVLGLLFAIPLVRTKRLWFTGGMHWAGNVTFYVTHEIMRTDTAPSPVSPNYILALTSIALIFVNNWLLKRLHLEAFRFSIRVS